MSQIYHSNAKTNTHIRNAICTSSLSNSELSEKYDVSSKTVFKWRNRDNYEDKSSKPHNIRYALSEYEQYLMVALRKATWLPLDAIVEMRYPNTYDKVRSSVYRTFKRYDVNKKPKELREKAKKFKEYSPGYLHIDVTYLPKFDGKKYYLFVAIDRATRKMFYEMYESKTSDNTVDFVNKCIDFFDFNITHILTDNGLEFSNRLIKSKTGHYCKTPSKLDVLCKSEKIDHRLIKPFKPQTNGMVERVNGIIKADTIKIHTYNSVSEMDKDLTRFLINYNLYRRHGSLRSELRVRTPNEALLKWYELEPGCFHRNPKEFEKRLLSKKTVFNKNNSTTL